MKTAAAVAAATIAPDWLVKYVDTNEAALYEMVILEAEDIVDALGEAIDHLDQLCAAAYDIVAIEMIGA